MSIVLQKFCQKPKPSQGIYPPHAAVCSSASSWSVRHVTLFTPRALFSAARGGGKMGRIGTCALGGTHTSTPVQCSSSWRRNMQFPLKNAPQLWWRGCAHTTHARSTALTQTHSCLFLSSSPDVCALTQNAHNFDLSTRLQPPSSYFLNKM